jgi:hypothetical protein
MMEALVGSSLLQVAKEERVWEAAARWMRLGHGPLERGAGLLGKVRFPLMEEGYLAGLVRDGCGEVAGLGELVGEAVGLKSVAREEWGRLTD